MGQFASKVEKWGAVVNCSWDQDDEVAGSCALWRKRLGQRRKRTETNLINYSFLHSQLFFNPQLRKKCLDRYVDVSFRVLNMLCIQTYFKQYSQVFSGSLVYLKHLTRVGNPFGEIRLPPQGILATDKIIWLLSQTNTIFCRLAANNYLLDSFVN